MTRMSEVSVCVEWDASEMARVVVRRLRRMVRKSILRLERWCWLG